MADHRRVRRPAEAPDTDVASGLFTPTPDTDRSQTSPAPPPQVVAASAGHSLGQFVVEASDRPGSADPIVRRALTGEAAGRAEPIVLPPAAGGAPLPGTIQRQLESSLGQDLGGVRVHTDGESAAAATALEARAFTIGQDIHFAAGTFAPETPAGRHLIAHEVAHTIQQRSAGSLPADAGLQVSRPSDPAEVAADRVADAVAGGGPSPVGAASVAPTAQRQAATEGGPAAATAWPAVIVQREPEAPAAAPVPPTVGQATVSPGEAAERVSLRLFDSAGYFAATRAQLEKFKADMMQLGWYAGDKKKPEDTPAPATGALRDLALEQAKDKGKAALSILLQGLSGAAVGATPAGAGAAVITGIVTAVLGDLMSYQPVITQLAEKSAHQIYAEGLIEVVNQAQAKLRDKWTEQRDESMAKEGAAGLQKYADQIQQATTLISTTYYPHLVAGYLPVAPDRSVELETPHAKYTGEGRGFKFFEGASHYVSEIKGSDVYVELKATGYDQASIQVVRTIVPKLPSTVLARLNDASETQGHFLGNLPFGRLVMEANSPLGPARVVYDLGKQDFDVPDSPHFSKEFCRQIGRAVSGQRLDRGGSVDTLSELQFMGAVNLYGWTLSRPMSQMKFQA